MLRRLQTQKTNGQNINFVLPFFRVRHAISPGGFAAAAANGGAAAPPYNPRRHTPSKGVHISLAGPNWVFLTVCTEKRERWLAQQSVQQTLHKIWQNSATAWLVSDYLLMPDHLHLFCAPYDLKSTIERWMGFWKDRFAKTHSNLVGAAATALPDKRVGLCCRTAKINVGKFQTGGFHHRLRDGESYAQKWQYVRENPVRQGLVKQPEEWLYSGRVHEIKW